MRGDRRQAQRHRRAHRRPHRLAGGVRRGARFKHGEGSGGGLWASLSGSRSPQPPRRARRLATFRRGACAPVIQPERAVGEGSRRTTGWSSPAPPAAQPERWADQWHHDNRGDGCDRTRWTTRRRLTVVKLTMTRFATVALLLLVAPIVGEAQQQSG